MAEKPATTISGTHGVDPHDKRTNIELRHDTPAAQVPAEPESVKTEPAPVDQGDDQDDAADEQPEAPEAA